MKKRKLLIIAIAVIIYFCLLTLYYKIDYNYFGFKPDHFTIVESEDTHGGPHGDGFYHITLDCSGNREEALEIISDWTPLPLEENLQHITYEPGYTLAEKANIPPIENGYYYFFDKQADKANCHSADEIFDRCSFNIELGIYDTDTDMLYYYAFDT